MTEDGPAASNQTQDGDPSGPVPTGGGQDRSAHLRAAEVQHRIRNLLALLQSVVRRTAGDSESVADYVAHLEGRLGAIARGQEIALWNQGRNGVDLEYLVAEELLANGAQEGERVALAGPPTVVRDRAAMLLGLAFHELAVNAVKFGALSDPAGRIRVTWKAELASADSDVRRDMLCLQWKETVSGRSLKPQITRGFGTELIERMLPYELGASASLGLDNDGLRCTIRLPLTADVVVGSRREA